MNLLLIGVPGIGKTTLIERIAGALGDRAPYRVSIANLEAVEVAAVRRALDRRQVVVIDEIGKMELISPDFKAIILETLESDLPTISTIGVSRIAFMEVVRRRRDVQVIWITRDNREGLRDRLLEMIRKTFADGGQMRDQGPA